MSTSIENLLTHRDWVRRVARALVSSEAEASEIEQEAWVRAVASPPASEGKARAWFRTVLRRIARDRWRKRTRREAREERAPRPAASADTADLVAEAESHRLVVNAALALPQPYRETIVLRFFHELPAAEIAERLDVPLETVRTRVKRALARLREELDDRHGGDRRAWTAMVALLLPATGKAALGTAAKAGLVAAAAALLIATVALWPKTDEPVRKTTIAMAPIAIPEGEFEEAVEPEIEPFAAPPVEPAPIEEAVGPSLAKRPAPPPEPDLVVTVVDSRGRPVAGALIRVHPKKLRDVRIRERREAGWAWARPAPQPLPAFLTGRTDAAGKLVISDLPEKPVWIHAGAAGFFPGRARERRPFMRTFRIALRPAAGLTGTVRLVNGRPVVGATVSCGGWNTPPEASSVTGRDGRYRLAAVPVGRARLAVRLENGLGVGTSLVDTRHLREFAIVLDLRGSVRGRVVDGAAGKGVAGAEVVVQGSQRRGFGWWTSPAVKTGADGTYEIEGLPVGRLTWVRARADGYLPVERSSHPLRVELSGRPAGLRDLRLARGAVVSGEVRFESGGLAPGVELWLLGDHLPNELHTVSDRRGRFRFPAVPAGVARIYASGASCWQRNANESYRPARLPDDLRIVVPSSGEVRKTVSVVRGAVVTGVVTDAEGRPRAGVEVFSRPGGRVGAGTDEDGRFRLTCVPTGIDVRIGARRMGGGLGWSDPLRLAKGESRSDVIVVAGGPTVVTGRVRVPGGVLPDGVDLRIASVVEPIRSGDSWDYAWEHGAVVPVAGDGTFRAEWYWPNSRSLIATADGCGETIVPLGKMEPGESREGVEVRLLPEMTISGRVVRKDGKSTAGAPIHVLPWPKDAKTLVQSDFGGIRAFAGPTGRFTIRGISHGRYRVTADLPGMIGASQIVTPGTEDLLLTARPALRITGILMNADTKEPAPWVSIDVQAKIRTVHRPARDLDTRSGADGRFVLGPLDTGSYRLTIGRADLGRPGDPEYVELKREVSAGARSVRIWLVPGRVIEGRVLSGARQPLGDIYVSSNRGHGNVTTRHDGTFRLTHLRPGKHELRFTDHGDRGFIRVVKKGVPAGTKDLLIVMKTGPTIAGTLVDPDGNVPSGRGRLWVTTPGARRGRAVRVGTDGSFRTPPIPDGRSYDLVADGYDDTIGIRVKGIVPGTEGVRVVLRRGATISGRVLDADGNPVGAGVYVSANPNEHRKSNDPQGIHPRTRTTEDGTFVLRGVGDFTFHVVAAVSGSGGFLGVRTEAAKRVRPGTRDLILRVTRTVHFSGRLVDKTGRPVVCRLYRWQHNGSGKTGSRSKTTAEGKFSWSSVRPGPIQLVAEIAGVKTDLGEFTAPATDLVITVP